jgi:hypothetical protein
MICKRITVNLSEKQRKLQKIHQHKFNIGVEENQLEDENYLHENQLEMATKIRECFDDRSTLSVSAIAPCQSGKTGTMIALVGEILKHQEILIENIFLITGHSSKSWEEQTRTRLPDCLSSRVFHRNRLNQFRVEVSGKTNVLIIIDEMHIAAGDKKTVYDVFKNLGYMDSKNLYEKDIKIAEFSATPDGVIVSRKQWNADQHKIIKGNPGTDYTSHADYLKNGRMMQSKDLSGFTKNNDPVAKNQAMENVTNLAASIIEYHGSDNHLYHIIRMPQKTEAQAMLKSNIYECAGNDFNVLTWDESKTDISCLDTLLQVKPPKHTFILIKEMLRCADTIEKKFIGDVYERYSKNPSDSAQIQGLAGRVCGYGVPNHIRVYVNVASIKKYIELYEGNFENIEGIKWKSTTTGKGTYADNENYSSSSKSSDNIEIGYRLFDDNERHTSLPKFCKEHLEWKPKADAGYDIKELENHTSHDIITRKWGLNKIKTTRRLVRGVDGKWVVYWLKEKFPNVPSDE